MWKEGHKYIHTCKRTDDEYDMIGNKQRLNMKYEWSLHSIVCKISSMASELQVCTDVSTSLSLSNCANSFKFDSH